MKYWTHSRVLFSAHNQCHVIIEHVVYLNNLRNVYWDVPTRENPFGTGHIIRYRFTTRTECGIKIKANRGQSLGAHLMDSGGMNSNNTDYDYSGNEPPSLWDVAMTFKGRRDREHQCTDTRVWSRDTALLYF